MSLQTETRLAIAALPQTIGIDHASAYHLEKAGSVPPLPSTPVPSLLAVRRGLGSEIPSRTELPMGLTIGSLFSGVGGLELGLERAGLGPVLWQCEIDPFCWKVLEKQWPGSKRYPDVRAIGKHNLEPVDLIAGGFPCVGFSNAGKKEGLDNEQSSLWWEFARVVSELRPRFVVIENVAAIRSRGLAVVVYQLAYLGYIVWWDCLSAAAVGAPHQRRRLFIIGHLVNANSTRLEKYSGTSAISQKQLDAKHPGGLCPEGDQFCPGPDDLRAWRRMPVETQPGICRNTYGVSDRLDRIKALGNAVVPAVAKRVGQIVRRIAAADSPWVGCECGEHMCLRCGIHAYECGCPPR